MRIGVIRSVPGIIPDSIEAAIGRYRKCAEPVPFIREAIVIDPMWGAEGQPTIGTAYKHHVGCRSPGWFHAGQHVNVVVSRAAGVVDRQERLPGKPSRIDRAAENQLATHVNLRHLVKGRCLVTKLRVA